MAALKADSACAQAPNPEAPGQAAFPTLPLRMQAHQWEGENDFTAGGPARGTGDAFGTACAGAAQFRPRLLPTLQQPGLIVGTITGPGALVPRRIMISGGLGGASRDAKAGLGPGRDKSSPPPRNPPVQAICRSGFCDDLRP